MLVNALQLPITLNSSISIRSYVIDEYLCFLVICDDKFQQNVAFAFLLDLKELFHDKLKAEYGSQSIDYRSKIETIDKKHAFIKYGKRLIEIRKSRSLRRNIMTVGNMKILIRLIRTY